MSTELVIPNIAKLVIWFLLDQPEITTGVGDRVFSDPPESAAFPMIRVTQTPATMSDHRFVASSFVQVSAWGPGKGDRSAAHDLAETAAMLMHSRLRDRVSYGGVDAVVSHVHAGGVHDDTDPVFHPAKPRSWFTAMVYVTPDVTANNGS